MSIEPIYKRLATLYGKSQIESLLFNLRLILSNKVAKHYTLRRFILTFVTFTQLYTCT